MMVAFAGFGAIAIMALTIFSMALLTLALAVFAAIAVLMRKSSG